MNSTYPLAEMTRTRVDQVQQMKQKPPMQLWLAAILGLLLLTAPRSRIVFGAPIYFIDVLAFLLLLLPLKSKLHRWVPELPISRLVILYLTAIFIGEIRGMLEYGVVLEPVYMMARYTIAISLFFTIPRLVSEPRHINFILKGMVLGTLLSAIIVILYALGPTRSTIVSLLFSKAYLNPGWRDLMIAAAYYSASEAAMRGQSLVGAATMTTGFLGIVWPLAFIAYDRLKHSPIWRWISLATIVVTPMGLLMTYGRGAWIIVIVVVLLIAAFGLASGRKILLTVIVGITFATTQMEINYDLFYFDRVTQSTQRTIDDPFADVSTSERLLSFVQPFGHLMDNPSWLFAGSGRAGSRAVRRGDLGGQLYDETGLATHSAFAMAYYSFGVLGAVCQVLFVALGFRFILSRLSKVPKVDKSQRIIWQALLMSWCTYSLWWASGYAIVGEPRGTMLNFLLFGLLVTFEKLRLLEHVSRRRALDIK